MAISQELLIEFTAYEGLNRVRNIFKDCYLYFNDLINVSLFIEERFIEEIYREGRLLKNRIYQKSFFSEYRV